METLKKILSSSAVLADAPKVVNTCKTLVITVLTTTTLIIQHTEQLNEHRTQERAEPNGSNVGRRGDAA